MKILKIASYYKTTLDYYYNKFPNIKLKTYKEQISHLLKQRYGWSDSYQRAFEKKGLKAYEIIYNAEYLQKQWAKENNTKVKNENLLLLQIQDIAPNIIWFQDSFSFSYNFLKNLKHYAPSIKIIVGNCCAPFSKENLQKLKLFDFTTTCSPAFLPHFKKENIKTLLLYHAFDPIILDEIKNSEKNTDFTFIGSLIPKKGFHENRIQFLNNLAKNQSINLKFYGNLSLSKYNAVLKEQILFLGKNFIKNTKLEKIAEKSSIYNKSKAIESFPKFIKISKNLKKKYYGQLFGIDMFNKLAQSKTTIDIQGEIGGDFAATMRLFESTGVGTLLLVENKKNIPELFEPNKEIITFNNLDDAIEKINWYLQHNNKRIEIAKNGQQKTLNAHTYDQRAEIFLKYLSKFL